MARKTASTKRLSAKPWTGLWTTFQERAQAFASKLPVIKPGVALIALAMAAFTLSVAGAGIALTWRVMRIENRAYVAQSISDTASILAAHVRDQVEHVSDDLLEIGHSQLKPVLVKLELDRKLSPEEDRRMMEHTPTGTLVGTLEVDPEILDISIWRRGSVQSRVPVRAYLATNSRYLYSAPEILQKLLGMESAEAQVVGSVFQGAAVMRSEQIPDAGKMAFLAIPLGKGFVSEVIVAHLRLDRFQKAFRRDGKIWLSLVDSSGEVLAHPDSRAINDHLSLAATPIFQLLKGSSLMIGQTEFMNSRGERYFGGYSRIGFGDLAVLASISEADATSGLEVVRTQTWIYLTLLFLACTVGCYFFFGRKKFKLPNADWMRRWIGTGWSEPLAHAPDREPLLGVKSRALPPEFRTVTVLHGTLRQVTTLLEKSQPEEAASAINDFFTIAASRVKAYEGIFERQSGTSFIAVWGAPDTEGNEIWKALRCALDLRRDFSDLNGIRKTDGLATLSFGTGVHCGRALAARIGPAAEPRYTAIGEVILCARALDQLAASAGTDLLTSQETWQQSEARFTGEQIGEAKLTADTGLTSYYRLTGYRDQEGQEVLVEALNTPMPEAVPDGAARSAVAAEEPIPGNARPKRWLVNNGSQIIGPLTPEEIAVRLYSQELDLDCECWAEGNGNSAQIRSAGIFSGSEDEGASLWLFDGNTVHGPLSPGFLRTALLHGALPHDAWICQDTTTSGWKTIAHWDPTLAPPKATAPTEASVDSQQGAA